MVDRWISYLQQMGGTLREGEIVAFDGDSGLSAAVAGGFVCDLSAYSLLEFAGQDAEAFLHAQLSSDVKALAGNQCQLATYNSPKGRMLATLLVWRSRAGFFAQLPRALAEGIAKRLAMFVLRSKVSITHASDRHIRLGVGGPSAQALLRAAGVLVPAADWELVRTGTDEASQPIFALRLPAGRYELIYDDIAAATAGWRALCDHGARPAGAEPWRWLGIQSGIAEVDAPTQDKFVPQMLNLELIGAVSFTKGCYPGQEIVARTQYRGALKRRTLLAHLDGTVPPAVGDDVVAGDQIVGAIAAAAAAPGGGFDVLACLHVELIERTEPRLRHGTGDTPLRIMDLPYKIPAAT